MINISSLGLDVRSGTTDGRDLWTVYGSKIQSLCIRFLRRIRRVKVKSVRSKREKSRLSWRLQHGFLYLFFPDDDGLNWTRVHPRLNIYTYLFYFAVSAPTITDRTSAAAFHVPSLRRIQTLVRDDCHAENLAEKHLLSRTRARKSPVRAFYAESQQSRSNPVRVRAKYEYITSGARWKNI